jgi:uncharacterized linocin/CFP29 family protein
MYSVGRDEGILLREEMEYVDSVVVETIKPAAIVRRLLSIKRVSTDGGVMWITTPSEVDMSEASVTLHGAAQADDQAEYTESSQLIPVIQKNFKIQWRDLAASRRSGQDLYTQYVRQAARKVLEVEEKMALTGEYDGWACKGIQGLLQSAGNSVAAAGNWPANAIDDINAARSVLQAAGFVGMPFDLIGPPAMIKCLDDQLPNTEITYRSFLTRNGLVSRIWETAYLFAGDGGQDSVLLVQASADNFDLVESMPPKVNRWEYKDGNIYGYLRECVVPRIKRAASIYEITDIVCSAVST